MRIIHPTADFLHLASQVSIRAEDLSLVEGRTFWHFEYWRHGGFPGGVEDVIRLYHETGVRQKRHPRI
jgi:hypothetical protein